MNPVCFHIGNRPVYWYGVMVALAFLACIIHWSMLGKKEGRSSSFGSDLGLWLMIAGIAGARVGYVLANINEFISRPWDIIRIDEGGLIFYGGFIGASVAIVIISHLRRERLWQLSDFTITALPLGHAIGRVGCFMNGCCYGTPAKTPWSVEIDGIHRHPTQLYASLLNIAIYLILLRAYPRRTKDGRILALYLMMYPTARFVLEFMRGDERAGMLGLSAAQYICVILFTVGLTLWLLAPGRTKKDEQPTKSDCSGK